MREEKFLKLYVQYSQLNCEDRKLGAPIYLVDLGTINYENLDSDFWQLNEKPDENDITVINPKIFFDTSHVSEVSEWHETENCGASFLVC